MTTIPGMSDITFEKIKLIADLKSAVPLAARGDLNQFGLHCRLTDLRDGTIVVDAGGKVVRRLQVILDRDTHGLVQLRKFEPWDWDKLTNLTYDYAMESLWEVWQSTTKKLYEAEKESHIRGLAQSEVNEIDRLHTSWCTVKSYFYWDARIRDNVDLYSERISKLEHGLHEVSGVAPRLAGELWAVKLFVAYVKGDTVLSRDLEMSPPRIVMEGGDGAVAKSIKIFKDDADVFSRRHNS